MDVISWGFFFTGVNGASFVRRSGDIWVTGCRYVETVTFVWNSGEPKGELRGVQFPPPRKFRSFDKVEPDCKLSGKCLVFLFQLPN